jgi:prolyl 4-hydroxylase
MCFLSCFRVAADYSERNAEAMQIGPNYVTNPVNAYLLIKRLTSDWQHVESMMRENSADAFLTNITEKRAANQVKYPDDADLTGAAVALLRLQVRDPVYLSVHGYASRTRTNSRPTISRTG